MEAVSIGSANVRKHDLVVVAPYLLHRNPNLWAHPDNFCPERFLPGAAKVDKHAYLPFAAGPRVCPGMSFAMMELMTALAVFTRAFDFKLAPNERIEINSRGTLRPGNTLKMKIRPIRA